MRKPAVGKIKCNVNAALSAVGKIVVWTCFLDEHNHFIKAKITRAVTYECARRGSIWSLSCYALGEKEHVEKLYSAQSIFFSNSVVEFSMRKANGAAHS